MAARAGVLQLLLSAGAPPGALDANGQGYERITELLCHLMMPAGTYTTLQGQGVSVALACCCGASLTPMRLLTTITMKDMVISVAALLAPC